MLGRLTGAGSDVLLPLVARARRSATVVGVGRHATYLVLDRDVGEEMGELLALVSRRAVRVPCAIVLAHETALLPGLVPGARAQVGAGEVRWDGGSLAVVRWWQAATVTRTAAVQPDRNGLAARVAATRLLVGDHRLPSVVPAALLDAARAIQHGDAVAAAGALRPVLGLGSGLTPSADDAAAGLLLAARSWYGAAVGSTVSAVGDLLAPGLSARTTAVSAGLLRHAARGRGAPQVVRAVEHLTGRHVDADERAVLGELVALGHSSGRDTALGILAFLEHEPLTRRTLLSSLSHPYAHRPTARESA